MRGAGAQPDHPPAAPISTASYMRARQLAHAVCHKVKAKQQQSNGRPSPNLRAQQLHHARHAHGVALGGAGAAQRDTEERRHLAVRAVLAQQPPEVKVACAGKGWA